MKDFKKLYRNNKWHDFSAKVKRRDGFQCLKCQRNKNQATLQVHHKKYISGLKPWDYSLSDCITLCKGCHALEHNLVEPSSGWTLISINDLGDLSGLCERKNCGRSIRYEHEAYHPNWGYKIIGSTCIEFLTEEDKNVSSDILRIYSNISKFVHESDWYGDYTQKGKYFLGTNYGDHILRIYGKDKNYAYQVAIKEKGENWYIWDKPISTKNKNLNEVKELAYIVAKGKITEDNLEKERLRTMYCLIK